MLNLSVYINCVTCCSCFFQLLLLVLLYFLCFSVFLLLLEYVKLDNISCYQVLVKVCMFLIIFIFITLSMFVCIMYFCRIYRKNGRVVMKVEHDKAKITLITSTWQTQFWYPTLLRMSIRNPLPLPSSKILLQNFQGEYHPLVVTGKLTLAGWLVFSNSWQQREYQEGLLKFSQMQGEKGLSLITNVDPFRCPLNFVLDSLAHLYQLDTHTYHRLP